VKPLSRYLQPDTSDARLARVWSRIKEREELRRPRRRVGSWALAVGSVGVVVALAALFLRTPAPSSAFENAALETAGDTLAVTLGDGSELKLDSRTRVQVVAGNPQAVALVVTRGKVSCDVTHRPGRTFVVRASGVEVRVVGTRFTVSDEARPDGARVEVKVERGVVEVVSERHPGVPKRLSSGQSFTEWVPLIPSAASAASAATTSDVALLPVDSAAPPELEPPSKSPPTRSSSEEPGRLPREPSARELLDAANTARRNGDARAAAEEYAKLLRQFPSDSRAGLAAFELGRLRMDRLGDLAGAAQALERAVRLAPGSGFSEDARARLVTAYQASGRTADCTRARDAYLAAYPAGVHRDAVSRGCRGR
jgi:transmembrane sensor